MSRFDRCAICDYNESGGSEFAGLLPFECGRVLFFPNIGEYYCEVCAAEQITNLVDLTFTLDPDKIEENQRRNYRLFKRVKIDEPVE